MKEWTTEPRSVKSNTPAIPCGIKNCSIENSQENTSSHTVQPPLPRLDLPVSDFSENRRKARLQNHCVQMTLHWNLMHKMHNAHHMHQEHASQHVRTLGSQPSHLVIFICKDTIVLGSVDYQLVNVEL